MAESSLSLGLRNRITPALAGIAAQVAFYLGFRMRELAELTDDQALIVRNILAAGLRRFYYPEPTSGYPGGYTWTFLRIEAQLHAWPTTTGTVSAVSTVPDGNLLTIGANLAFDTMLDRTLTFTDSGNGYRIIRVPESDGDQVVVEGVLAAADGVGDAFSIASTGNYRLPDDFSGVEAGLWFDRQQDAPSGKGIDIVNDAIMASYRQRGDSRGRPEIAAVVPLRMQDWPMAAGQRFEIRFWPVPDQLYRLGFRYVPAADTMTIENNYPLGGAIHAETILASCLAVAELRKHDEPGPYDADFQKRLAASIHHDVSLNQARTLGYNGDKSDLVYGQKYRSPGHRRSGLVEYTGWN